MNKTSIVQELLPVVESYMTYVPDTIKTINKLKSEPMPFRSKAQMRMMFAKDPRLAKRWAHKTKDIAALPEKVAYDLAYMIGYNLVKQGATVDNLFNAPDPAKALQGMLNELPDEKFLKRKKSRAKLLLAPGIFMGNVLPRQNSSYSYII